MEDKTKLHDINAEATWLSTVIEHPNFLRSEESDMRPDFFYDKTNKCLAWGILKLIDSGVDNIDIINLEGIFNTNKAVKRVVDNTLGEKGLQNFLDNAKYAARPTCEEFKLAEKEIETCSAKRDIIKWAISLQNLAENDNSTIEQIDDYCNTQLQSVINKYVFGSDSYKIGDKIDEIWAEVVSKRTKGGYGIPFFLPRLNDFCSLVAGECTVVIGETGRGKSSFFLQTCLYTALNYNLGVVLIDSELTDDVWLPRALASISGLPVWKIKTGKFESKEEEEVFKQAYNRLSKAPIVHYYLGEFDRSKIRAILKTWVSRGYSLGIIDYLKPRAGHYDAAAISQDLGEQANELKQLSSELSIPILTGQQQSEDTKQAADSKKVRRYVDTELVWEEKPEDEIVAHPEWGNYRIRITKNRNGPLTDKKNYIDVNFEKDCMRISQAEMHQVISGGENPFE